MISIDIHKKLLTTGGEFELDASITIPQGEIVAFYGPSGSGKTTLLRIIAGLAQPDGGELWVGNDQWLNIYSGINLLPQKRRVGYVFQDYALFPNMTVLENIRFAQDSKDTAQVEYLLSLFGLSELRNRKPSLLSGGQQQRVALARALACKPSMLLLDEPLSALDNQTRSAIQDEIKQIRQQLGITIILVSHDMSEIFKLCNRVFAFENGTVTDKGAPGNLFANKKLSGKVQLVGEVLDCRNEDIIGILTILVGNTPVKVAVPASESQFVAGDKVLIATKAFNPIIQKIESTEIHCDR